MFNPKGVTGDSPGQRPGVSLVAIRCQAVGVARKLSTVWRRVATVDACGNSSPPAAKRWESRGKPPPSGDAWLPSLHAATRRHPLPSGGSCEENVHRLATRGYRRCMRQPVAIRCKAVGMVRRTLTR